MGSSEIRAHSRPQSFSALVSVGPPPRRWARFRARLGGYFWKPCPFCGEWFSGREWEKAKFPAIPTDDSTTVRRAVCPRHTAKELFTPSWVLPVKRK